MIKIAVCQYQIENLSCWDDYVSKITSLVGHPKMDNTQLLLLPEYAGAEIGGHHQTDKELYHELQPLLSSYFDLFINIAHQKQMYIQPGTILVEVSPGKYLNRAYFFGPNGKMGYQDKLQLTEFEKSTKLIHHGHSQTLFETSFGKIGIAVCYDSEFPEIVRRLTLAGAWLILVPSYTTSLAGYYRVFSSCRARALENQCYVATAFAVGTIALSQPIEKAIGSAVIFGPIEHGFSEDGILAQGSMNKIEIISADLSVEKIEFIRKQGEVHNYEDTINYNNLFNKNISSTKM